MTDRHNGDNAELKIFSFTSQRQRMHNIGTFIHTKQPNTQAQPKQPKKTY